MLFYLWYRIGDSVHANKNRCTTCWPRKISDSTLPEAYSRGGLSDAARAWLFPNTERTLGDRGHFWVSDTDMGSGIWKCLCSASFGFFHDALHRKHISERHTLFDNRLFWIQAITTPTCYLEIPTLCELISMVVIGSDRRATLESIQIRVQAPRFADYWTSQDLKEPASYVGRSE